MTLPQITSRNQIQTIPTTPLVTRLTSPATIYTCPTGKKALITGVVRCDSRGAANDVDFNVAGVVLYAWSTDAAQPLGYLQVPRDLSTADGGQEAMIDIQLDAGETITYSQDIGSNASMDFFLKIQETPI